MRVRVSPPQLRHDRPLVRGVAEGEEQADGDRLGVAEVGQRAELERRELAVRPDPPAHAERALERHERLRMPGAEPVEVRAILPAQVEHVLEALGRHERRPRAAPLQQRVGRDRRPVREALELAGADRRRRGEHRLLLVPRRRHLRRAQLAVLEQDGVGEGAAHVDAQDGHGRNLRPE